MKGLAILGSTGSIGTQTLEVAAAGKIPVVAISGGYNITLLEEQARRFLPALVCTAREEDARLLKTALADTDIRVTYGEEGLCEVATAEGADAVLTAVVGSVGLVPTLAAIDAGKTIALANKETLVAAGGIVTARAKEKGVALLPVDSEHSAIFQCLQEGSPLKKLWITASGGSFYGKTARELEGVTVEQALRHPNWSMGRKITIDSATLMNKGLEVIEAHWLFGADYDDIEVLIHRESIIHSMVQFADNSIIAQLGVADMRLPIHYALHYPERVPSLTPAVDLSKVGQLTFGRPDTDTFRALPIAVAAGRMGGTAPAAVNAANEAAVALFLDGKIAFLEIFDLLEKVLTDHKNIINPSIDDIIDTDREIREALRKEALA